MRYLKALAAATVLLGFTLGVPIGLAAGYGNPVAGLTHGLVTDTTVLDVLACLAWAIWAQMTLCFALETVNQIRGIRGSTMTIGLPGFGPQAELARVLVGAVIAVGVIGASAGIGAGRAQAEPAGPVAATSQHASPTTRHPSPEAERTLEVVVQPGDSLWKLAETHLGNGAEWRVIADLNHGRQLGDGVIATTAILQDGLQPGWNLRIPTTTADVHVVAVGENLSEIAQHSTGNAANWPSLYAANRAIIGSDPNLIYPGEDLTLPTRNSPTGMGAKAPQSRPAAMPSTAVAPPHRPDAPAGNGTADGTMGHGAHALSQHKNVEHTASASEMQAAAPWLVGSLLFTGGILAGHLQLRLRERGRARSRARRPGRLIAAPDPEFLPLEKTISMVGGPTSTSLEYLDLALRHLGQTQTRHRVALPELAAVELTDTEVIAHLTTPGDLPGPWEALSAERLRWRARVLPTPADEDRWDLPAPYPLLATMGHDEQGHWWLLNLEQLGVLTISGDPDRAADLMRYVAAELAVANSTRPLRIDLIGLGTELDGIEPDLHIHNTEDPDAWTTELLAEALQMIDRSTEATTDAATGRAGTPDDEVWAAQLIISSASNLHDIEHLPTIVELIQTYPGRTGTALLTTTQDARDSGIKLEIGSDGKARIDQVGLTLTAAQLPAVDAAGITDLYRQASQLTETAVPEDPDVTEGAQAYADAAGNLREEHCIDRSTPTVGIETSTLLQARDETYLDRAAVVEEDLEVLAPRVPATVSAAIRDADPLLEDDLADWIQRSNRRPRLHLLGEVKAVAYGGRLHDVGERPGFFTELLAFLWTHSKQGATVQDVVSAFPTLSPSRARTDITILRQWLGTNAQTGEPLLPSAKNAPARADHHRNVYQVDCGPGGLLVDIDLLRRLRVAAQATGGAEGIARMTTALVELVGGKPFSGLRSSGWSWLLDADRIDQHMVVAISDMAHIATSHYLAAGDVANARVTADIGLLAAPYEETMRLDLVAVKEAEGDSKGAAQQLSRTVLNRSDDGYAPLDPSHRTRRVLKNRGWGDAL